MWVVRLAFDLPHDGYTLWGKKFPILHLLNQSNNPCWSICAIGYILHDGVIMIKIMENIIINITFSTMTMETTNDKNVLFDCIVMQSYRCKQDKTSQWHYFKIELHVLLLKNNFFIQMIFWFFLIQIVNWYNYPSTWHDII